MGRSSTSFKPGNQLWKQVNLGGRDKKYTPEERWSRTIEYFEWCEDNPIYIVEYNGKDALECEVPKMRPFTYAGLCLFLNVNRQTLLNYEKDAAYFDVCRAIHDTLYEQKFSGAATGALNPNIIARDLGLVDKKEVANNATHKIVLKLPDNGRKIEQPKTEELEEGKDYEQVNPDL